MICPGEPEVNYVIAGDSSLALVDFVDNNPSTRRNIGEYLKEKPELLPGNNPAVWHCLRWGRGLPDIITGVEQSLDSLKRRGTSRPAIVVISYTGNDIFGKYGFIHCEWIDRERACYSQQRRDAADAMLKDRVQAHFMGLNDLVKLSTRPDVGNIVLVMPWYGRGYGLHPDFDRQMIREAESLRKRGLCVLDATSMIKSTTRYDGQHMENLAHNRMQSLRFFSGAGALGYHLFRLRSCKGLIEIREMKRRREESLANPLPENNPSWEEMEEVLVSVDVDGWEIFVKEKRPKGQRLPNEVDKDKVALHYDYVPQDDGTAAPSKVTQIMETMSAELPGEPEHLQPHEVIQEPEMDDEMIDAVLQPYLEKLQFVSDEPDLEDDADEEIVFKEPIVGGSASHLAQRKLKPHASNKIHAVDFRLDGSGVMNVLNTDLTRDPEKLELRFESQGVGPDGPLILRRYDLNDEEQHKQLEREIFMEELIPEARLRAGDPDSTFEIVAKKKAAPTPVKAMPSGQMVSTASSSSTGPPSGVAEVIGDTVGQFLRPATKDQATMIAYKPPPPPPVKGVRHAATSPMASPKPSPPPTPRSEAGDVAMGKPDPPPLPEEIGKAAAAGKPALPYKNPPTSPRVPPKKMPAKAATEPAPKVAKTEAAKPKAPPPGTGGPQPPSEPPSRPEGYPRWYSFSPGTGEPNSYTIRGNELPGLRDIAPLGWDDFKFAKRISGLLRGYEHKDLQPHHKVIPPDFDDGLYLPFEGTYTFLKRRFRAQLSREDLYLLIRTQDRFLVKIEAGQRGQLSSIGMPYRIVGIRACQGHDLHDHREGGNLSFGEAHHQPGPGLHERGLQAGDGSEDSQLSSSEGV